MIMPLGAQAGVERLGCWGHARRKFVEAQKVQPKGKTGRADIALNLINKLYGIERERLSLRRANPHAQNFPSAIGAHGHGDLPRPKRCGLPRAL